MDAVMLEYIFLLLLSIVTMGVGIAMMVHMLILSLRNHSEMVDLGRNLRKGARVVKMHKAYFLWDDNSPDYAHPVILYGSRESIAVRDFDELSEEERIQFLYAKARAHAEDKRKRTSKLLIYPLLLMVFDSILLLVHLLLTSMYFQEYLTLLLIMLLLALFYRFVLYRLILSEYSHLSFTLYLRDPLDVKRLQEFLRNVGGARVRKISPSIVDLIVDEDADAPAIIRSVIRECGHCISRIS